MMVDYGDLLKKAWSNLLAKLHEGSISIWSEGDLQSQLFREIYDCCLREGCEKPFQIHSEISVVGCKPDLVLGNEEIVIELKHERDGTGGHTQHRVEFDRVVEKMTIYSAEPRRRSFFIVLDETGYFARPDRKNFFDPTEEGFDSSWIQGEGYYHLCAEYGVTKSD